MISSTYFIHRPLLTTTTSLSEMRFYNYDPFAEFDRLFEDACVARFPSCEAVRRENNNKSQTLFRPKYVPDLRSKASGSDVLL